MVMMIRFVYFILVRMKIPGAEGVNEPKDLDRG
jgi:hypothetical protein